MVDLRFALEEDKVEWLETSKVAPSYHQLVLDIPHHLIFDYVYHDIVEDVEHVS